jgi:20S proteasome alpha/beta subunit
MTTCVAVLCDDATKIVLAADKRFSMGYVESDPETSKILAFHKRWHVMIAGNDIPPALDIIDAASESLAKDAVPSLRKVMEAFGKAWQEKRVHDSEARILRPIGMTLTEFKKDGRSILGDLDADKIRERIGAFEYNLFLLVAGFDEDNKAHLFRVCGGDDKGVPERVDLPGYDVVGIGNTNGLFFLNYRDVGPKTPLREALYCAYEAKYHGEWASSVGWKTDLLVLTPTGAVELGRKTVEEILYKKLARPLSPGAITKEQVDLLNSVPELESFPLAGYRPPESDDEDGIVEAAGDQPTPQPEAEQPPNPPPSVPDQTPPTAS